MGLRPVTLIIAATVVAAVIFTSAKQRSSAQQDPIRKQPACTMYCGEGPDTFSLGAKPCWGGPLPADNAGDHFNGLPEETQAVICRSLLSNHANASCPAVKTILGLCKEKNLPKDEPEKPKPPCKERGEYDMPWFDPSAEGCQKLQETRMEATWNSAGGGTCTLRLRACNYVVLTMSVKYVERPLKYGSSFSVSPGVQVPPEQHITRAECTPQLYAILWGEEYPGTVCCDIWDEGVRAGSGCNPETDADCDGLPNDRDDFLNSTPYYAPPRPDSYQGETFQGSGDFNRANFDPRPSGLSWDELMPNEPCKKCKWMATSGKLTCSPDGRADHEYKATWVCPSSGSTKTVTKRAPASAPCAPPLRSTP